MALRPRSPGANVLVGRDEELQYVRELLVAAADGRSSTLLLRGDAGVGKTALLAAAIDMAHELGLQVVEARGVESESQLAFAALADLLRPVQDALEHIPAPQAAAVRGALALAPPTPDGRFAVSAGTLSVLAEAADEQPLLVAIDDAQWLDDSSAGAIAFAARRLDSEGVAIVAAVREGEQTPFDPASTIERTITALSAADAARLLADSAPHTVAPEVANQVAREVGGNPLAVIEVARALTAGQLAGAEPLGALPAGPARATFTQQLRTLDDSARLAVLIVASSDSDDVALIHRALHEANVPPDALSRGVQTGLVVVNDTVRLRHALVRDAVFELASTASLHAAHAALAAAASGEASGAWHRAAAADGPDEDAAQALEATAAEAASRGGLAEAASALELAAELTPPGPRRADRLLAAARDARRSGNATRAARLLDQARPLAGDAGQRARVDHARGVVDLWAGKPKDGYRRLVDAAEDALQVDAERAARMLTDAAWAALVSANIRSATTTGRQALAAADGASPAVAIAAAGALGIALLLAGDRTGAMPLLTRYHAALDTMERPSRGGAMPTPAAQVLMWFEEYDQARAVATHAVERARSASQLDALPFALAELAELDLRTGYWQAATANAAEAARIADETGQETVLAYALACAARVDAACGREERCRTNAARAIELGESRIGAGVAFALSALGLLDLGQGRAAEAAARLELLAAMSRERGLADPNVVQFAPDLVEAHARAGNPDRARDALGELEEQAQATGGEWAQAVALRCRAMLCPEDALDDVIATAVALHERSTTPFELARTRLVYGERLRRVRRRADARAPLYDALAAFEHLRAEPWAARARAELQATGEHMTGGAPGITEELTPQELQVALVVAEGATNREAGAMLFLSPKTIEAHLSRVYRKLGVRSRTELARTLTR